MKDHKTSPLNLQEAQDAFYLEAFKSLVEARHKISDFIQDNPALQEQGRRVKHLIDDCLFSIDRIRRIQ